MISETRGWGRISRFPTFKKLKTYIKGGT